MSNRSMRFSADAGPGIFLLIFCWVFMWGWCGGVEIDGKKYVASCACDPIGVVITPQPAPERKP